MFRRVPRELVGVLLLLLVGVLVAVVWGAASTQAARYDHSNPRPGEVLPSSPASVDLYTGAAIVPSEVDIVQVQAEDLTQVDGRDTKVDPGDPRHLSVSLRPNLAPGRYVVSFVAQSADIGDLDRGQFSFYIVGQPTAANRAADSRLSVNAAAVAPQPTHAGGRTGVLFAAGATAVVVVAAAGAVVALRR